MADLFISYSTKDAAVANRLTAFLDGKGITYWRDTRNLEFGSPDWLKAIEEAIKEVRAFVILLSPISVESPWVTIELGYAMGFRRNNDPDFPIFALVIKVTEKLLPPVLVRPQILVHKDEDVDFMMCWTTLYDQLIKAGIGAQIAERSTKFLKALNERERIRIRANGVVSRNTLNKMGSSSDELAEIQRFLSQAKCIHVDEKDKSWTFTQDGENYFKQHAI
ncbi:MAG: toll/interleukin-1 receptor domain-containing protein [Anaerolineae bacterium]|nr:toll/interleukin-1 receptor domain-containing protein [Anaerolineae bacterium]